MKICDICHKLKSNVQEFPSRIEGGQPVVICSDCTAPAEVCPGCDTAQIEPWRKTIFMPSNLRVCTACQEREHVTVFVRKVPLRRPGGPRLGRSD